MKNKYTRNQIAKTIKYWKKYLTEALGDKTEENVLNTLKNIIETSIRKTNTDIDVVESNTYLPPYSKNNSNKNIISIFHAGKGNNNSASDIYIQYYNTKKQVKTIGIEVKDSFSSNVFNPGIKTNVIKVNSNDGIDKGYASIGNYKKIKLQYKNQQFDNSPRRLKSDLNGFFMDLLNGHEKDLENQVQIALAGINHFINSPYNKGNSEIVNQLPYTPINNIIKFATHGMFTDMYTYSQGSLGNILEKYFSTNEKIAGTPVGNAMQRSGMKFNRNSVQLVNYDIQGNDLIKMYFNELRKYKKSAYLPVQYLQFNNTLYSLGTDETKFFNDNGSYKLANIDDDFNGLHISWRLAFPDGKTHNQYRIVASVSLLAKQQNNATLTNIEQAPQVNIEDINIEF